MRLIFPVALASILFVAVPASACGGAGTSGGEGAYEYCNDYTIHVGDESQGLHANEKGQFYLATGAIVDEGWYFEQDVAYADTNDPWPAAWLSGRAPSYSLWWYFEANDRPGAQRADEACNNTPQNESSDTILC